MIIDCPTERKNLGSFSSFSVFESMLLYKMQAVRISYSDLVFGKILRHIAS